MDFFQAQDHARQSTSRLVIFFSLAVVSLIVMTNLLVMVVFGYVNTQALTPETVVNQFDWEMFGAIGLGVIVVVGLGSLYKIMALSGGGSSIAEMMGGELIVDGTGDAAKQKILNVVEEMAIASGSPVPPVYLLKETAINAFAAGYSPSDAVIGVTRGAIDKLSRDELQGVIAHEFSHIFNGDMRLNIRLIGILHGILVLGMIGYYLMRSTSRSRSSKKEGGGLVFLGLGLMVIGYSGTFFGNLIKAAVSRQREFLADASAVQFTRNPDGIGGALKRIGADEFGSLLANPNSSEISHALFSQGFTSFFGGLFATHPPLAERIKKIQPDWDGEFTLPRRKTAKRQESKAAATDVRKEGVAKTAAVLAGMGAAMDKDNVVSRIGHPTEAHLEYAHRLLRELPPGLKKAVRDPFAARAAIYFLVLDADPAVRDRQLKHLQKAADRGVYTETVKLLPELKIMRVEYRLALVDLALPVLHRLTPAQYELFRENLDILIAADGKITLFEWCLQKIVTHHLGAVFGKPSGPGPLYSSLRNVADPCAILLSLLVYATSHRGVSEEDIFTRAAAELPDLDIKLAPKGSFGLKDLNVALDELDRLQAPLKSSLIKACAACVVADGRLDPVEAELLRAISATLDCPMPPLVVE